MFQLAYDLRAIFFRDKTGFLAQNVWQPWLISVVAIVPAVASSALNMPWGQTEKRLGHNKKIF